MVDNYNDLTVGMYEDILAADALEDDVERQAAVIAALSGMGAAQVLDLPLPKYRDMSAKLAFLREKPQASRLHDTGRLRLGRATYSVTRDTAKMTAGQYIDFDAYLRRDDLCGILSTMLIPEGCTYGHGYDFAAVQADIRAYLTIPDALALRAFFLRRLTRSIRRTLRSSALRMALLPRRRRREAAQELSRRLSSPATASPSGGAG